MLCFRYRKLLIPYTEGVLDERARLALERHISRCRSCAAELGMVRRVSGALRSAENPAMEPAADLWAKVSARIEAEASRRTPRTWLRVTQAASACAAAVLLALIGIGMFQPNAPGPEPERPSVERSEPARVVPQTLGTAPASTAPPDAAHISSVRRAPRAAEVVRRRPASGAHAKAPMKLVTPAEAPAPAPGMMAKSEVVSRKDEPAQPATRLTTDANREAGKQPVTVGTERTTEDGVSASAPTGEVRLPESAAFALSDRRAAGVADRVMSDADASRACAAAPTLDESIVDTLNKTEGVHVAALFAYP